MPASTTASTTTAVARGRPRTSTPRPVPISASTMRVPTIRATLSFVPNQSMARSLTPGGTLSIT